MTLANCEKLLKHFENIASGKIEAPHGHKDWELVVTNAKIRAEEMRQRIARKRNHPKYAHLRVQPKEENKDNGSKSKR